MTYATSAFSVPAPRVGLSLHQQAAENQTAQKEQQISHAIRCITGWLKGNRTTVYTDACVQDYEHPRGAAPELLRRALGPAMDELVARMFHSMNRRGGRMGETGGEQRTILRAALQRGVELGAFKVRVSCENGAVGFGLKESAYKRPPKATFRNDPYRVKKRHGRRAA